MMSTCTTTPDHRGGDAGHSETGDAVVFCFEAISLKRSELHNFQTELAFNFAAGKEIFVAYLSVLAKKPI